jgi:hypothetical protein
MSERRHPDAKTGDAPERERPDEPFLKRWSRLKSDSAAAATPQVPAPVPEDATAGPPQDAAEPEALPPGDEDMPPLESLDESSDFSGFMSPRVSAALRKQALRKLFRSPKFNVISELDDYIDDYRNFPALGDIVTSDMKHAAAELLKRQLEAGEAEAVASAERGGAETDMAGEELAAAAGAADDDHPAGEQHDDDPDSDDSKEPARDA